MRFAISPKPVRTRSTAETVSIVATPFGKGSERRAGRPAGPWLDSRAESEAESPLLPMNPEERLVADFRGTGMTVGPHPMAYHRERMDAIGVHKASDLAGIRDGKYL